MVKHEALAINQARRRIVGSEEVDLDALEASTVASPEDHAETAERVARTAEALHSLKPQEVRAIWLKALGHSYEQIAESTGWSYTKVNRCLAEGRKSFLARYAGIEAGEECVRLAPAVSAFVDGEAGARAVIEVRNHLRACAGCRAVVRGLHEAAEPLSVVLPAATLATTVTASSPPGSGLFSRVYETLAMTANERAANAVLRAQAVVDTVASGKMAVAAASVAAVAGGGVAVQGAIRAEERPAAIMHRAQVAQPATRAASAPARRAAPKKHEHAGRRRTPRRPTVTHPRSAATQTRTQTQTQQQAAVAPPPPATTSTAPAQQPVTRAASTGSSGGSAAGEFGFESP